MDGIGLLDTSDFPPRWECGTWTAAHGWTHIVSDSLVFGAYVLIPIVLVRIFRKRRDVPFSGLFWVFAVFIVSCGVTHLIEATIFWHPWYRLSALVKVVTAGVSWAAVIALAGAAPKIMALRLPETAAEHVVRRSGETIQHLVHATQQILFFASPSCRIHGDTTSWCAFTGQDEERARGVGWLQAVHESDRLALEHKLSNPTATQLSMECRILGGAGEWRWMALRGVRHSDGAEEASWTVLATDVTGYKQAEAKLRSVVESAPLAMVMVDQAGTCVLTNREAERLFGYSTGELIGRPVEALVPSEQYDTHVEMREQYQREATARRMGEGRELYAVRKDASRFPVEIGLNPVVMEAELGVLAAIVDISVRKKLEDDLRDKNLKLEASNIELQQFAYIASHDLQSPLRSVSGFAEFLRDDYAGKIDERADDYIQRIMESCGRMQSMINDLLAYSRVESKARPFAQTSLDSVLRGVLDSLDAEIDELGAEITVDKLPTVSGDASQLTQLFQNLIGNSLKYHGDEPLRIHVAAEEVDSGWEVCVEDNGIGIDEKHHQRVFEIFRRLHSHERYPGTGIGLAVCRRIVDRHGGRIWIDAAYSGGTRFVVGFPDGQPESSSSSHGTLEEAT